MNLIGTTFEEIPDDFENKLDKLLKRSNYSWRLLDMPGPVCFSLRGFSESSPSAGLPLDLSSDLGPGSVPNW